MDDLIQQGVNAYKSGDLVAARSLLTAAVKQYPDNERAWGWMYNVCASDTERILCLKQIVRINPKNENANESLLKLLGKAPGLPNPVNSQDVQSSAPLINPNAPRLTKLFTTLIIIVLLLGQAWLLYRVDKLENANISLQASLEQVSSQFQSQINGLQAELDATQRELSVTSSLAENANRYAHCHSGVGCY